MSQLQRRYSDQQRAAIGAAYIDGARGPAIAQLAAAGALKLDGLELERFDLKASSAKAIGERAARRARAAGDQIKRLDPLDAVELFRLELASAIGEQLRHVRAVQARGHHAKVQPATLQGLARAIRELQSISLDEPGKRPPGTRTRGADGRRSDGTPGADIADQLRAAMVPAPMPSRGDLQDKQTGPEGGAYKRPGSGRAGERDDNDTSAAEDGGPGSYAAAQIAKLQR